MNLEQGRGEMFMGRANILASRFGQGFEELAHSGASTNGFSQIAQQTGGDVDVLRDDGIRQTCQLIDGVDMSPLGGILVLRGQPANEGDCSLFIAGIGVEQGGWKAQ